MDKKIEIDISGDIIVFGSGTVAAKCIDYLRGVFKGTIYVFEIKHNNISILQKHVSNLHNVKYSYVGNDIEAKISKINCKLIFSISNIYIFKKEIIKNHVIINYHNALLPKHKGRFAEAWAIYSQDKVTGITWHVVSEDIDCGDILCQSKILLDNKFTALTLLMLQSKLAIESFKNIVNDILKNKAIKVYEQNNIEKFEESHYSWEKPNEGYLNLSWNGDKISAFLRAMDYGALKMLGEPYSRLNNTLFSWRNYAIENRKSELNRNQVIYDKISNSISINKENMYITLLDIKRKGE